MGMPPICCRHHDGIRGGNHMQLTTRLLTRRAIQRSLAALSTAAILFGMVPTAFAAEAADTSKIEPALLSAVNANPNSSFHVIVTRGAAGNRAKTRLDESDV